MSLEHGVMPCLEGDSIVVFLLFSGGLDAHVDTRVKDLWLDKPNDGHVDLDASARVVLACICVMQKWPRFVNHK